MSFVYLIIAISVLILIHEAGHFFVARFLGIKVEEFGFGFPPRVFSRVKNGVRYSFNLLPFGGFVKIFGERGEGVEDEGSFAARATWQRFLILFAGVFMNAALAWLLFSTASGIGIPQAGGTESAGAPVSVIAVMPDSPAENSGLKLGDQILRMRAGSDVVSVTVEDDVSRFTRLHQGEEVMLRIRRGQDEREITTLLRVESEANEGPLGIAMGRLSIVRVPWYETPVAGARMLWWSIQATVAGLGWVLNELLFEWNTDIPVAGPIGIFQLGAEVNALGISYFLQFIALLSVNLAVLNVLPIPALDGGRIFFLAIEKIRGVRMSPRFENAAHAAGLALLILLMLLVTYKDVTRIIY